MSKHPLQLTLREWRAHFLSPLTLTALFAVSAILSLVGPYGTADVLSLPERAVYWSVLVIVGYGIGYISNYIIVRQNRAGSMRGVRVLLAGLTTGIVMTALVVSLNLLIFDFVPGRNEFPFFAGTIIIISIIVMAVVDMFIRRLTLPTPNAPPDTPAPPPILDRLPFEKRASLVAIAVEDHYVRIYTLKGEEMILMRLADAIRETGETKGAQVHRSHWANFEHIARFERQGDRAVLHMTTGLSVPVSRANMPKLREAGLLPA